MASTYTCVAVKGGALHDCIFNGVPNRPPGASGSMFAVQYENNFIWVDSKVSPRNFEETRQLILTNEGLNWATIRLSSNLMEFKGVGSMLNPKVLTANATFSVEPGPANVSPSVMRTGCR